MDALQVVSALVIGIFLGILFASLWWKARSSAGEFLIKQNEEGQFSYVLQLEEEPEGLHKSRYVFFKVKK